MSTIAEMIAQVDENKPNAFSEGVKVRWIAELDGKIAVDVFLMHHSETAQFNYKWPEDMNTQPLVPFPHDDIYLHWLEAKIDYANGEYNKYQNTMELYNETYSNFSRWFTRVHRPANCGGTEKRSDVTQYYITAYGLAVMRGYEGSLDAWLEDQRGPKGDPGVSPYEFAVAGGFEGTEAEFLYKLLHDGKTAWEYAAEGGYKGTEAEFTQLMANAAHKDDIPKIDTTLTAEGQAADAKATGDALGKKADTSTVDAALAKKADAIEDTEYPGCYYRMAGNVKEWISPPMVAGVEYQTTERWNGKTVFVRRIYFGTLAQGETTIDLGVTIATANMVRYDAYAMSKNPYYYYKLPMVSSSQTLSATVRLGAKQATIFAFSDLSAYDGYMNIWYTKN